MKNLEILAQTILPICLHGVNPRTIMGKHSWDTVKKQTQQLANNHCMICEKFVAHKPGDWLECHEHYEFDCEQLEATLKCFVCICSDCHHFIHQGRLRCLVQEGKVSKTECDRIIERGDSMLASAGLSKNDLPNEYIMNPHWTLLYNGKRFAKLSSGVL